MPADDVEILNNNNLNFALNLFGKLRQEQGNMVFSPFSISQVLTMTYIGARGETARDMEKALSFTLENKSIYQAFQSLNNILLQSQLKTETQFHLANSLWLQSGFPLLTDFKSLLKEYFHSEITSVDFRGSTEKITKKINQWVKKNTNDKVRDFISRHSLQSDTVLVLVNAIYFKAKWQNRFDKMQTKNKKFKLFNGRIKHVPTMQQQAKFGYTEIQGAQILEMPYTGDSFTMLVMLPAENSSLDKLENKLTTGNLSVWLSRISQHQVSVSLPRFKIIWGTKLLNIALMALGMSSAFIPGKADFSGIDNTKSLYISRVLHKAFIEINESGSEAAAASAVTMKRSAPQTFIFNADRPFLFLIREKRTGAILFIGRVVDPG